jgi:N-acetylneuraminic acid mutarotase
MIRVLILFPFLIFSFCVSAQSTWTALKPMNTPRVLHALIAHPNGNLYAFGGDDGRNTFTSINSLEAYNIANDSWTTLAPMPRGVRAPAYTLGANGLLYSFGGYVNGFYVNYSYSYDPATDSWATLAPMPVPRMFTRAFTAPNGLLYIFGGYSTDARTEIGSEVQIYNPQTNAWSRGKAMPQPLSGMGGAVDPAGRIHLYGGVNNYYLTQQVHLVYDPVTDSWSTAQALPNPARTYMASATGADGLLYTLGGSSYIGINQGTLYNQVDAYNTATNTWTGSTPLPTVLTEAAAAASGPYLYVSGGQATYTKAQATLYRLQAAPDTNSPPLPVQLAYFQALLQASNQALVRWETSTELNSDYFAVERSSDGKQFITVAQVPAAGTSSQPHSYEWHDPQPLSSITYYRLRQVDVDLTKKYSSVSILTPSSGGPVQVQVYPSPSPNGNCVRVAVRGRVSQPVTIAVTDLLGRTISTQHVSLTDSQTDVLLALPIGLVPGVYGVHLRIGSQVVTTKLVLEF